MLSASLILAGCQKKNSAVEDSVANQTKRIEHNLEKLGKICTFVNRFFVKCG
jgi:hypothetical protein